MNATEFKGTNWKYGDQVILEDGDVVPVIAVHFGMRNIKVKKESGSEWVSCEDILRHGAMGNCEDGDLKKELKMLKAENKQLAIHNEQLKNKLENKVRAVLQDLQNFHLQAQNKLAKVEQDSQSVLIRCEKIDVALEQLKGLLEDEEY